MKLCQHRTHNSLFKDQFIFFQFLDELRVQHGVKASLVGRFAQNNKGICYLTASQWRLKTLCAFESYSKPCLWHWPPLSFFTLKKSQGQCCPLFFNIMCWLCYSFLGKDLSHLIFPAICMDLESKDRPKGKKELTSSHMTLMSSRTQGLNSAFPQRIPPEPWGQASKNGPGLLRRGILIVHFYSLNVFSKTHFLSLLSTRIFPRLPCSSMGSRDWVLGSGMWAAVICITSGLLDTNLSCTSCAHFLFTSWMSSLWAAG